MRVLPRGAQSGHCSIETTMTGMRTVFYGNWHIKVCSQLFGCRDLVDFLRVRIWVKTHRNIRVFAENRPTRGVPVACKADIIDCPCCCE